jgi:hypothetical protein
MTDQLEFDLLRQICSARLKLFITAARKTELSMKQLTLPLGREACRQFSSQRRAEFEASENYHLASLQLRDFLGRHSYSFH